MRNACLDMVHRLACRDPRVVYVGSDPGAGTLDAMRAEFPDRVFIEGIAEQNVVGLAAGLALEGFIPYVHTIASFLTRRCYEQVAIDLCQQNLPVRLIGNGGGLVYAPLGPTHTAPDDLAITRVLPNMAAVAVADATEMRRFMARTLDWPSPIYIRLGKGGDPVVTEEDWGFDIGRAVVVRPGRDAVAMTTGTMLSRVLAAADSLAAQSIGCGVLHLPTVKPIDAGAVLEMAAGARLVVVAEEHSRIGGLGAAVLETLADGGILPRVLRLGIADEWSHAYGSQDAVLKDNGLDADGIAAAIQAALVRPEGLCHG